MDNSIYLFAAFSAAWTIIFIYVFMIFRRQKAAVGQIIKIKEKLPDIRTGLKP